MRAWLRSCGGRRRRRRRGGSCPPEQPATWMQAAALVVLCLAGCGWPRLALTAVPVQDDDRYDVREPPERVRDDYYDALDYTLFQPTRRLFDLPRNFRWLGGSPKQAMNVTPLDEIQDSSWFTNRIGLRDLTPTEVGQGPNAPEGPDRGGPWTIVRAKTQGVTPGFTIQDPQGQRFVIKFDPATDPELATGAEAICTRLYWALGYNVPENYVVHFPPDILRISPDAKVGSGKKRRSMTQADLDAILAKVPRAPDGNLRAIASRFIAGKPIGPPTWLGRRESDPNDVIPHEHRRELRAYRVFCAWLHHNDSRQINAADFFVEEEGRNFVRHYLIDFGATLGSRSYGVNLKSEGYEYLVDFGHMFKSIATVGLYERPWTDLEFPEIRGVGRFEAAHFDPSDWKPDYPNPAFDNLTPQDGFWGAKLVMRFSDAHIRAAVEGAQFTDPQATEYVMQVLAERRDRIGRYWFAQVNPLDRFELGGAEPTLRFQDLAVLYGFESPRRYHVTLKAPKGESRRLELTAPEVPLHDAAGEIGTPAPDDVQARLVQVEIRSSTGEPRSWTPAVHVTLYLQPSGRWRIAAIQHDS